MESSAVMKGMVALMALDQAHPCIEVSGLRKTYGSLTAVDGLSFQIFSQEIFGMVGPNGAGKTTTIECIEGLRTPDAGSVRVLGYEVPKDVDKVRPRIGAQLQQSLLQPRMKVWEAMDLYAALFPHSLEWEGLLKDLGLDDKRNEYFSKLSGGQKQRLFVALALVGDPEILFLDELTTGLDPHGRRLMWDLVRGIRDRGKTIFLTTHFMEEAERLCDRVAIVDGGRIVALDTPENLIDGLGSETRVVFVLEGMTGFPDLDLLQKIPGVSNVSVSGDRVEMNGKGKHLVSDVVGILSSKGIGFKDLKTESPTLEDVFLALTGRRIRPEGEAEEKQLPQGIGKEA